MIHLFLLYPLAVIVPAMRRLVIGLALAAAMVATPIAAMAEPVAGPSPDQGPTDGGTRVTLPDPRLDFQAVSNGTYFSVALATDGQAYGWGSNIHGQLGDGNKVSVSGPVRVAAPAGITFTQISVGWGHSLGMGSDGNIYAWGNNTHGQLGNGSNANSLTPVPVSAPSGVTFVQIDAGDNHSLALTDDGLVYAWGNGGHGRLGNDGTVSSNLPVLVNAPADVTFTQVSAGNVHSLAVSADGDVYGWGSRSAVAFDDGPNVDKLTPVRMNMPADVTFTEVSGGATHSLALTSDGGAYAWGSNVHGQLGDGTTAGEGILPAELPPGAVLSDVAAGGDHSLGLTTDGRLYAWGGNHQGQLGAGNTIDQLLPTQVSGSYSTLGNIGYYYTAVVGTDGSIFTWGNNTSGQQGYGSSNGSLQPSPARLPLSGGNVTSVTFDRIPGSDLVVEDGLISVTTPPHAAGAVDVTVEWTRGGSAQPAVVYPAGFTYVEDGVAPLISDPSSVTVYAGETASFTVTASGTPAPTVGWEISTDEGASWAPIPEGSEAVVSDDGLTLMIAEVPAGHDAFQYRATATNSAGSAVSAAATLTVLEHDSGSGDGDGDGDGGNGNGNGNGNDGSNNSGSGSTALASTGADANGWVGLAAAVALSLAGAAMLAVSRIRKRNHSRT